MDNGFAEIPFQVARDVLMQVPARRMHDGEQWVDLGSGLGRFGMAAKVFLGVDVMGIERVEQFAAWTGYLGIPTVHQPLGTFCKHQGCKAEFDGALVFPPLGVKVKPDRHLKALYEKHHGQSPVNATQSLYFLWAAQRLVKVGGYIVFFIPTEAVGLAKEALGFAGRVIWYRAYPRYVLEHFAHSNRLYGRGERDRIAMMNYIAGIATKAQEEMKNEVVR